MPDELLIDQALAINAAAEPVSLGDSIPISPAQALVYAVYLAQHDAERGLGEAAAVNRYVRTARSAGLDQREIDAALQRAGSDA